MKLPRCFRRRRLARRLRLLLDAAEQRQAAAAYDMWVEGPEFARIVSRKLTLRARLYRVEYPAEPKEPTP